MKLTAPVKISLGLVCLTVSVVLAGDYLVGLTSGRWQEIFDHRRKLCETLAVQYSALAEKGDFAVIKRSMKALVERNPDVLSAALRTRGDRILAQAGDHPRRWIVPDGPLSALTHAQVPIYNGEKPWGTLEVRFAEFDSSGLAIFSKDPLIRFLLFTAVIGFVAYLLLLRRTLRHLDPSAVVPERVRTALNLLTEGVILVDESGEIVLSNTAFEHSTEHDASELLGRQASDLGWHAPRSTEAIVDCPWTSAMRERTSDKGRNVARTVKSGAERLYVVNSAPIIDEAGKLRGAMATFDDVTVLEETNAQLLETVQELDASYEEIQRQNQDLERLATTDPLSGCLNRRAFFDRAEKEFMMAQRENRDLSCIMIDIDHFKSFNDRYGHAVGDQVIQEVAQALGSVVREYDMVCRYGGEEFCILVRDQDLTSAAKIAERARSHIEVHAAGAIPALADVTITASLGASSIQADTTTLAALINEADQALYRAKESGRNRVVRWDELGQGAEIPSP